MPRLPQQQRSNSRTSSSFKRSRSHDVLRFVMVGVLAGLAFRHSTTASSKRDVGHYWDQAYWNQQLQTQQRHLTTKSTPHHVSPSITGTPSSPLRSSHIAQVPASSTKTIKSDNNSNNQQPNNNINNINNDNPNLEWWQRDKPLLRDWPYLKERADIHPWLEKLGYKRGIEVGVQRGMLARRTLRHWPSCLEYKLVDLWGADPNYKEPGKDNNDRKNAYLAHAQRILEPWTAKGITEFLVMRSTDAAPRFANDTFDYVYIDARHDYCAVQQDIAAYWPKVRPGGILAGHDFIDAPSAMEILGPQEDWSYCEDGVTREPRAVKGAVEDFAKQHNLDIVTTHEGFSTWLIQKPYEDNNNDSSGGSVAQQN